MMRQYQQGIATLLITSILLSVALVVTLGSYKNLFYQIKRAQNEVKARQEHWLAEGGLECAYSNVKEKSSFLQAQPNMLSMDVILRLIFIKSWVMNI